MGGEGESISDQGGKTTARGGGVFGTNRMGRAVRGGESAGSTRLVVSIVREIYYIKQKTVVLSQISACFLNKSMYNKNIKFQNIKLSFTI